jgi:hypothetical protein
VRACSKCKFFLHGKCAKLPERLLQNPFHPLTLQPIPNHDICCYACNLKQTSGFIYRCNTCDVNFDRECAFIRPDATQGRDESLRTDSSTHQHPLVLVEKMPKHRIHCRLCGEHCSDPTYGCFPCSIFLHRSCYERNLPGKIQHFFIPALSPCPLITQSQRNRSFGVAEVVTNPGPRGSSIMAVVSVVLGCMLIVLCCPLKNRSGTISSTDIHCHSV